MFKCFRSLIANELMNNPKNNWHHSTNADKNSFALPNANVKGLCTVLRCNKFKITLPKYQRNAQWKKYTSKWTCSSKIYTWNLRKKQENQMTNEKSLWSIVNCFELFFFRQNFIPVVIHTPFFICLISVYAKVRENIFEM